MEKETFDVIRPNLTFEDDPAFWVCAWNAIVRPIETLAKKSRRLLPLYIQFGCCLHWLRPHQTRLTTTGGFAWPSGYLGGEQSRNGLPEFDWQVLFQWNANAMTWDHVTRFAGKRRLVCRIASPGRTGIHRQAVVNVRWEPGTIEKPKERWRENVTGRLRFMMQPLKVFMKHLRCCISIRCFLQSFIMQA